MNRFVLWGNMSWKVIFKVILLFMTLNVFSECMFAQIPPLSWGFYHRAEPLLTNHPQDYFHTTGEQTPYSGIGAFSLYPRNVLPKTLFHLYSFDFGLTHHTQLQPAILRLQTAGVSSSGRSEHKTSSIEFRVGEILHPFGMEEQVCALKNVEANSIRKQSPALPKQRGLSISVQKQGKLGTEQDGMLDALHLYSERRTSLTGIGLNEWYPRVGIGNPEPLEHLHLGTKFTFHAGGASRIGDNVYFDMHEQRNKRITSGTASSISMHLGSIILANASTGGVSDPVQFEWGNEQTLRGIEIDMHNGMSIGKRYPQAALDIMTRSS
ncbi:MAG: hypothetical protein ACO3EO_02470, partial [Candidatus Kapaibacteriota bacterium]